MLNFSTEPYRDDFDPNKHFHRILFKPGKAIQARELTQSQTILQDQISKFAFHIFSQNTPVTGGNVTINKDCYYLKLLPEYEESPIDVNNFLNRIIRDNTGTVVAKVIAIAEETTIDDVVGDPPTLIVSYISGQQFQNSDVIYSADNFNFTAKIADINATGKSSTAHIAEGVFFVVNGYSFSNIQNPDGTYSKYSIGNFVGVQPQIIVLEKYNSTPTLRIGLNITETISDYVDDVSLLDPAIGASNYQAPGADRYVITLTLETRTLNIGDDQNFIELVRIEEGEIKKQVNSTVYSVIDDYFAKRTSETNGNFIVNDFVFTPKVNVNDANSYIMSIGKGVAYVNGYRVENQSDLGIVSPRARTYANSINATINFEYGNYLYIDNLQGFFDVPTLQKINLHCVPSANVVTSNTYTYNSTLIGSAYIRNLEFHSKPDATANNTVYKAYITDIETYTLTGGIQDVLMASNEAYLIQNNQLSSSANSYVGCSIYITSGKSVGDIRSITEYDNTTGKVIVDRPFTELLDATSKYRISFNVKDTESIVIATIPVNPDDAVTITTKSNINTLYGKDRGFVSGYTKLIAPSEPEMIWPIGHSYIKSISDTSYTGTHVFRNQTLQYTTELYIELNAPTATSFIGDGDLNIDELQKNFIVVVSNTGSNPNVYLGQVIELNGTTRKIYVDPTQKLTAKLTITDLGTAPFNVNVITKVDVSNGDSNSIVRVKELYTGNTIQYSAGSLVSGTSNTYFNSDLGQVLINNNNLVPVNQPQSLYVVDVKRIVKIYDTQNPNVQPNATLSNVVDVTKFYSFSNGQKDSFYDHANITLNFGAPTNRGNLLVIFDYYNHSGGVGYFSGMSYQAPKSSRPDTYDSILTNIYTSKNGDVYRMSDSIDFRLSRQNGTSAFIIDKETHIIPDYNTTFRCDYDYYLGRNDILILTKDKTFEIIQGVPSTYPKFPSIPDDSMDLAKITLDPYTAYITGQNSNISNIIVQKVIHKTWKMKNISELEKRVNNIEYYTSLNLLEKNAESLQIPDENGLNRFKYGILADDFTSLSVADTANFDFNAAILKQSKQLTAAHTVQNYSLFPSILDKNFGKIDISFGDWIAIHGSKSNIYITLPYNKVSIIKQQLASRTINVNPVAVIDVIGDVELSPQMDTFIDNLKLPSLLIADPAFKFYEPSDTANLISQSDWKLITGTEKEKPIDVSKIVDDIGGITITKTFEKTWQESRDSLYGYYKDLQTNFIETNEFITDINIMPYVRAQDIEFKVNGLLTNTPLNCYFDNVNINKCIRLPNIIDITVTYGRFNDGDIIGYLNNSNVFVPTGKVLAVSYTRDSDITDTTYPCKLYVIGDIGKETYTTSVDKIIHSYTFNLTGTATTRTATGIIISTNHASGVFSKLNADYTPVDHVLYSDETGRDYSQITKANSLGKNNNVYLPKTLFSKTIKVVNNASVLHLSKLANNVANTYNNCIITIFNPNPVNGKWAVYSVITSHSIDENGYSQVTIDPPLTFEWSNATTYSICRGNQTYQHVSYPTDGIEPENLPVSYTRPSTVEQFQTDYSGRIPPQNQIDPVAVMSDEQGIFCGVVKLPGGTFYSGSKVFRVDNGIDGNAGSATTYAESVFFAANLSTQSQSLQFGSSVPGWTSTETTNKKSIRKESIYTPPPPPPPPPEEPLAQTFIIERNLYPNGAFLKNISLFFRTKSYDTGINIYLVETLNGFPTTEVIENSKVYLSPFQVKVSERPHILDETTKTTFEFIRPIYIKPDTLYAVVIKTSSIDYTCWIASQNDFALASTSKQLPTDTDPEITAKLSANPYIGTLFVSQNAITWTPEQTKSLMFNIDACKFNTASTPSLDFVVKKYALSKPSGDFDLAYYEANTSVIANTQHCVISTRTDIEYDMFNVSTTDFIPTKTKIAYSYDTTIKSTRTLTGNKQAITPGRYGTPSKDEFLIDGKGERIIASDSDTSFILTTQLFSSDQWVSPVIFGGGVSLFTTKWLINDLGIYDYTINVVNGGKNYSNTNTGVTIQSTDGFGTGATGTVTVDDSGTIQYITITTNGTNYATRPKIILDTIATANTTTDSNVMIFNTTNGSISNGSIWVGQTISNSNSQFSTTVISANNSNGYVVIANSIFNTATNQLYYISGEPIQNDGTPAIIVNCETCPNNGNGLAKYITKKVILNDEAGDLRVYYTAYKPLNSEIYVYYKLLSGNDNQKFEDGYWQLMTTVSSAANRYSSTRDDIIEFVAAPGKNNVANNTVSYLSLNEITYTTFNQFAIKIVMATTDSTHTPYLRDIRAIALPPATGM